MSRLTLLICLLVSACTTTQPQLVKFPTPPASLTQTPYQLKTLPKSSQKTTKAAEQTKK